MGKKDGEKEPLSVVFAWRRFPDPPRRGGVSRVREKADERGASRPPRNTQHSQKGQ
jgi:hypothetical protein